MKYYKMTDENMETANHTLWGEGIVHKATGKGIQLCSKDVIHVYDSPLKASMFNPIHANFKRPILWECRVRKVVASDHLKVGVKECKTIRQIELPEIPLAVRIRFSILVSLKVCQEPIFVDWANRWLSGEDRTATVAQAAHAAYGASHAAYAASHVTSRMTAYAAYAAQAAVQAAARASHAAYAAQVAARAAHAAYAAAYAASHVTSPSVGDMKTATYLVKLIKQAIKDEEKLTTL